MTRRRTYLYFAIGGVVTLTKLQRDFIRRLIGWTAFGIMVVLLVWCGIEIRHANRMSHATRTKTSFAQVSLALHNYHDTYGSYPPAFIVDENGKPMHSWRVLILPFVDGAELYSAYDFHEPWNGPNNSKLTHRMPETFRSYTEPKSTSYTNIVVITGPDTAFPGAKSTRLQDFRDGGENTIMLAEIANSRIPWLAPVDLSVETMSFRVNDPHQLGISSANWRQPYVKFASGPTYELNGTLTPESLKALTTISGGERITREDLLVNGQLLGTRIGQLSR